MAGVCGGSGFNKGLSTLSSASKAMSHISRLSARENVTDKRAGHEKVLCGESPVLWKDTRPLQGAAEELHMCEQSTQHRATRIPWCRTNRSEDPCASSEVCV